MKILTCAATRRRLHAFHDEELSIGDQIAVGAHLEWCSDCASGFAELRLLRAALRTTVPGRTRLAAEADASFHRAVVNRARAERTSSFTARVRSMFEDMHLVYAGLGAAAATVVCVLIVLGMMRFATRERPDSLAAMVNMLAAPEPSQIPVAIDARILLPWALDQAFSTTEPGESGDDGVFTLTALVTREGRISNLELLHEHGNESIADDAQLVESLMGAVSEARFEPARVAGLPVAVNMVWLVAHTTVRGNIRALDRPLVRPAPPAAKKRTARLTIASTSGSLVV